MRKVREQGADIISSTYVHTDYSHFAIMSGSERDRERLGRLLFRVERLMSERLSDSYMSVCVPKGSSLGNHRGESGKKKHRRRLIEILTRER